MIIPNSKVDNEDELWFVEINNVYNILALERRVG